MPGAAPACGTAVRPSSRPTTRSTPMRGTPARARILRVVRPTRRMRARAGVPRIGVLRVVGRLEGRTAVPHAGAAPGIVGARLPGVPVGDNRGEGRSEVSHTAYQLVEFDL